MRTITSDAVEELRLQLQNNPRMTYICLKRSDLAEIIIDYDALSKTYMRIMRSLSETQ